MDSGHIFAEAACGSHTFHGCSSGKRITFAAWKLAQAVMGTPEAISFGAAKPIFRLQRGMIKTSSSENMRWK